MENSLNTLSGNSGGIVTPSPTKNISVLGDRSQGINAIGNIPPYTLTLTALNATPHQKGVCALATMKEAIEGTSSEKVMTPQAVSNKLGMQTKGAIAIGKGPGFPVSWSSPLLDGQVLIGSSSGNPVAANLSSGTGISIQNQSGSISIGLGGNGAPVSWNVIVANQTAAPQNGYLTNSSIPTLIGLPPTSNIGDIIEVAALSFGGWKIIQTAGQQIVLGNKSTTNGASGYLSSLNRGDWVRLVCAQENAIWIILGISGNITII